MPDVAGRPFYDARPDPAGGTAAWTLDDLCAFAAAAGDPYGGRLTGGPFDAAADRLPPADDVEWLDNFNVRGLKELPVAV